MIIVSLTSTSNRLDILRFTLLSLLEQNLKADKIVLNLSKEAYLLDDGIIELPQSIQDFEHQGIEINWVENTGPYRKLLPVLSNANDDDLIITCDDDVIYGKDWLKNLIESALANPNKIVCGRARKPVYNIFNKLQSYLRWPLVAENTSGLDLVPIGIAGVVYRKNLLDLDFIFNTDFKTVAPKQDDLWFKTAGSIKNTKILVAVGANNFVYPIETNVALSVTNAGHSGSKASSNIFLKLLHKVILKIKVYLGFSVCGNDAVWKNITQYLSAK